MPEICRFYGIIIQMFYKEHNPPHFHVKHGDYRAVFTIHDFKVIEGNLPSRAEGMVREWAEIHKDELLKNWELIEKEEKLKKIDPLV